MSAVDELQLTKKRLQNLRRRSFGLQQLTVRIILKQLTFYLTHPDELEKLKNLPGVLRDKILQVLMKKRCLDEQGEKMEFENLKAIFPLLLSPRTRYIELNGILSFCPDRFIERKIEKVTQWCVELLYQIETRAPQVETLVIQRNNPFDTMYYYILDSAFSPEMMESLMKMQKLNRLTASFYSFNLTDLLKICKNLSRLEYVNVGYIDDRVNDRPTPEDVSSSFCNLKEFIYIRPSAADNSDWVGSLCTRNLPNIQVVEDDPNKIMEWIATKPYGNRHYGLEFPGTSNLRSICVDFYRDSAEVVEEMPKLFPKVTSLKAISTYSMENVMPQFNNIRNLHLLNSYFSGICWKYLITFGQKLQSLYFGHDHEFKIIDLKALFEVCPKLEKLSLLNVGFQTPPSKLDFFAELKELEWQIIMYHGTFYGMDGSYSNISAILSAPKLEKVQLESWIFNQTDLSNLKSMIEENRILNNLHTLHVYLYLLVADEADALKSWNIVLKNACALLPKLTDFKFGYRGRIEDPLLTCASTPCNSITEKRVCEMCGVFENEK